MAFSINRLDTQGWWMVGSNHIYIPAIETKVEHSNVVGSDSGRDETGIMHIDWVRRDVIKVFLVYKFMTAAELQYIFNLLQGKEITFTCRDRGQTVTFDGYVGESNYVFYNYGPNGEEIYKDVSINVIQK